MIVPATTAMVTEAAQRLLAQGEDLTRRTIHYAAQYLLLYDRAFAGCDYTQLVSIVRLWQRGFAS
ncbi:hypothetical protein I6F35_33555 [Bradyrhizobium sp. BRP22]|uniref:hypothetical protein n=1 Tax=Bradyrhizobium sp. BRP22 TaxID=2793821 RepID=UPI001CD56F7B|nr:hypothetical protein [Bradyrhizobium sp. BRP22]MCA1458062.1 hypothetical protein [Bradyrhizobium sp. BRP22]